MQTLLLATLSPCPRFPIFSNLHHEAILLWFLGLRILPEANLMLIAQQFPDSHVSFFHHIVQPTPPFGKILTDGLQSSSRLL